MNNNEHSRWTLWLSFPLVIILAMASCRGPILRSVYADETRSQAALSIGGNAGIPVLIMPVLVIAAILILRGSRTAQLVWVGTLVYLVCDFLGNALAIHFNSMFIGCCGVMGLCASFS